MFKRLSCLLFAFVLVLVSWAEDLQSVMSYYKPNMSNGFIYISKVDMTLTLVSSQGRTLAVYPMACGRVRGQKQGRGDNRTPEGHFTLQNIQDASTWGHDFNDGKGFIPHAYGPWFMRLHTGFQGIGIHGTHAPESIGSRASEGCIRLRNADLSALRAKVTIGMPVIIGPEAGVKSLIDAHVPAPAQAGPKGLTGVTPAKPKSVEKSKPVEKPAVQPAKSEVQPVAAPAKPVEPASVKVVDGMLDVAPETDVVVELPAQTQPEASVQPVAAETAEPVAAEEGNTAVEAGQAVAEVQQAAAETVTTEAETVAETAEAETAQEATATDAQAEATPQTSAAAGEPRYEVVVEEVTGPDGEVKFEVRYKLVE